MLCKKVSKAWFVGAKTVKEPLLDKVAPKSALVTAATKLVRLFFTATSTIVLVSITTSSSSLQEAKNENA